MEAKPAMQPLWEGTASALWPGPAASGTPLATGNPENLDSASRKEPSQGPLLPGECPAGGRRAFPQGVRRAG